MASGRKRKMGPRWPSGNIRLSPDVVAKRMEPRGEVIEPTPETLARRTAVFGNPKAVGELACPLDRMRSLLTQEQYWAGCYARTVYARYCIAIGMPRLVAGQLTDYVEGGGSMPMDEEQAAKAVQDYVAATQAVARYSRRALLEVKRIMHGAPPRSIDMLATGLTALADFIGLRQKKSA